MPKKLLTTGAFIILLILIYALFNIVREFFGPIKPKAIANPVHFIGSSFVLAPYTGDSSRFHSSICARANDEIETRRLLSQFFTRFYPPGADTYSKEEIANAEIKLHEEYIETRFSRSLQGGIRNWNLINCDYFEPQAPVAPLSNNERPKDLVVGKFKLKGEGSFNHLFWFLGEAGLFNIAGFNSSWEVNSTTMEENTNEITRIDIGRVYGDGVCSTCLGENRKVIYKLIKNSGTVLYTVEKES